MVVVLLALPTLYYLSIGPIAVWEERGTIETDTWVTVVYAPIIWLNENAPSFQTFTDWHVELWVE